MILADTSIWISYLRKDDPDLSEILKTYLKKRHIFTTSAIFGELFQGVKNTKEYSLIEMLWESLPKVEEENLFIEAGQLSNEYNLHNKGVGLIDCYILAATLSQDLTLWTLDKKLLSAFDHISQN
ncbi:MAG: PIN domain-containing protein [Cytophagales bacterium]|nr:PIN domain-containing protein [Cytophagales bacterium]